MQKRNNIIAQASTESSPAAADHSGRVVASAIVDQLEEMAPLAKQQQTQQQTVSRSKYRQLDSFSTMDSFDSIPNPYFPAMELQASTPADINATATLAAQALQIPALSESALLLLKTLRETANLHRAPNNILGLPVVSPGGTVSRGSSNVNSGPEMDHDEKVKVLRALYANRTRNKVSSVSDGDNKSEAGEKSNEEQQQRGEETSENGNGVPVSNTLEGELRKMIQQSSLSKVRCML